MIPSAPAASEPGRWLSCSAFQTSRGVIIVDRWAWAFFDPGSAHIKSPARALLDNFVSSYDAPPTCPVVVSGHSDLAEAKADDLSLSRRRADAVAHYLRRRGLTAPIRVEALGGTRLLVDTPSGVSEPQNRFVQVWVDDSQPLPSASHRR
jgi:outer membrane protein OmpA-like peptidoglycan-associated protein